MFTSLLMARCYLMNKEKSRFPHARLICEEKTMKIYENKKVFIPFLFHMKNDPYVSTSRKLLLLSKETILMSSQEKNLIMKTTIRMDLLHSMTWPFTNLRML